MRVLLFMIVILVQSLVASNAQSFSIEGYTYESGNRGYLKKVEVAVVDLSLDSIVISTLTNKEGYFSVELGEGEYQFVFDKSTYYSITKTVSSANGDKQFLKVEMDRKPGYLFEVTLAEKKDYPDQVVDAISGALIEVYNNTTEKEVMVIEDSKYPDFKVSMEKGNHYTILIRKKGFISKQMEAHVDIDGCILCFEGVGSVDPGVTDNLTQSGAFGVLLANVELDRLYEGKTLSIDNLYYALGSHRLSSSARKELNKVIQLLNNNPNLTVELGSHCDSRGSEVTNMNLSEKRAKTAVDYILNKGGFPKHRISYKGYGETLLLNHCANGVKCLESEHAKNRRTEIKILGVDEIINYTPLAKMKEAEKFKLELEASIQNTDEISEVVEIEKDISLDDSNRSKLDINIDSGQEPIDNLEENIELKHQSKDMESNEYRDTIDLIEGDVNEIIVLKGAKTIPDSIALSDFRKVENNTKSGNPKTIHILLVQSKTRLSRKHVVYSDYFGVREHFEENMYYYYIGEYENFAAAETHFDEVKKDYIMAEIFKLENGRRVE